jgi:hypothetical protein
VTNTSGAPAKRAWVRVLRRGVLGVAAVLGIWLGLIIHPQPLFAHTASRANIVLHARVPLDAQGGPLLDDVLGRVTRSPLYDPARVHHVFLCDTRTLFAFLEPIHPRVGGVAQTQFVGNVFIRPFNLARGTVIGPSGNEKTGERTLAYFIAHELTHVMTADRIGHWRTSRLPAFQREGYADYVAMARPLDLASARAALIRNDDAMDPKKSGLYRRYELLVTQLLDREHLSVEQLLAQPLDPAAVERRVRGGVP